MAARLPGRSKVVGRPGRLALHAGADDALRGGGHGCEEVGGGLLLGAGEAKVFEVGLGFGGFADGVVSDVE